MPGPELMALADEGRVALGGCVVMEENLTASASSATPSGDRRMAMTGVTYHDLAALQVTEF